MCVTWVGPQGSQTRESEGEGLVLSARVGFQFGGFRLSVQLIHDTKFSLYSNNFLNLGCQFDLLLVVMVIENSGVFHCYYYGLVVPWHAVDMPKHIVPQGQFQS